MLTYPRLCWLLLQVAAHQPLLIAGSQSSTSAQFSAATQVWGFVCTRRSYSTQGTLSPQCFSYPKLFYKLYPLEVGRDKHCIYTKTSIGINITISLMWQTSQRDLTAMVQKRCFKVDVCFFPVYCSLLCS